MRTTILICTIIIFAAAAFGAPSVQISGAYGWQTIGGIFFGNQGTGIQAIVQSDDPVSRVEFYLGSYLYRTETLAPYTFNGDFQGTYFGWDTTVFPNGRYTITAVAFDTFGYAGMAVLDLYIFNNRPPTAACSANVTNGPVPLTVAFTGTASDPDKQTLVFNWSFGDGSQSNLQSPVHTYNNPGVYIVRFTVGDGFTTVFDRMSIRAGLLPLLEVNGLVAAEAEDYDLWLDAGVDEEWAMRQDKPGFSGQRFVQYIPNAGVTRTDGSGPKLQYWIDFKQIGRYYIWIRGYASSGNASCRLSLNGSIVSENIAWTTFGSWQWVNSPVGGGLLTMDVYNRGMNILTLIGREDGLAVDKIVLCSDSSFAVSGTGPAPSQRAARTSSLAGDADFDGRVNILDLIFIRNRIGMNVDVSDNRWADVNGDHKIDVLDLIYTRNRLGK